MVSWGGPKVVSSSGNSLGVANWVFPDMSSSRTSIDERELSIEKGMEEGYNHTTYRAEMMLQ